MNFKQMNVNQEDWKLIYLKAFDAIFRITQRLKDNV